MQANRTMRVQKHRSSLRAKGMRPIQIWVPDTRQPAFIEEARRQSLLAAEADQHSEGLMDFLDAALADMA